MKTLNLGEKTPETQVIFSLHNSFLKPRESCSLHCNDQVTHSSTWTPYLGAHKRDRFCQQRSENNLQSNSSSTGVQGPKLSTCELLLLTTYSITDVLTGGAISFPHIGKLKKPSQRSYLQLRQLCQALLWDWAGGVCSYHIPAKIKRVVGWWWWKHNNCFRWIWTQEKKKKRNLAVQTKFRSICFE